MASVAGVDHHRTCSDVVVVVDAAPTIAGSRRGRIVHPEVVKRPQIIVDLPV